ncbi:MAG: trypsin-like peptidase domain-containing protein [Pseudomonadota bacterium]
MATGQHPWRVILATVAGFGLGVLFSVGGHELHLGTPATQGAEAADAGSQVAAAEDDILPVSPRTHPASERRNPVVEAVARTAPAVVSINCEVPAQSPFPLFYGGRGTATSQGSGAIIRADGVVLTNAHVVEGALRISATLSNDTSYEATVVGLDADLDLAVLQLEGAADLPWIPLGSSAELMLGETVIAIGNPFGLGHTVTTGVISSRARTLEVADRAFQDYIQTDAGINPGNSGGPLLDIHGELIGINTAIRRDAENIGFAIPVDRAAKVARDLLRYGSVRAPWLGLAVVDVGGPRYAGTPVADGAVVVSSLDPGAAEGGLEPGDVILRLDGRSVRSRADLNLQLANHKPGDTVSVTGLRGADPLEVSLTTAACPDDMGQRALERRLRVEVQPIDPTTARRLRASSGLVVTAAAADGTFAAVGLRVGDVILAVNGARVRQPADLEAALLRAVAAHRDAVLLTVQRGLGGGHIEVSL